VRKPYNVMRVSGLRGLFLHGAEDPGQDPATPPPAEEGQAPLPAPETPDLATPPSTTKTYSEDEVKKLREEAAKYRTERNALQKEKDDKAKSEMAEVDRLKLEKEEAEKEKATIAAELAAERIANAITIAATTAKFHAPADAAAFIKTTEIKLLEDGKPDQRSVKAAVEALAKEKPHLVRGPGSGDGGFSDFPKTDAQKIAAIEEEYKRQGMVKV
jgi:hypothetical protein